MRTLIISGGRFDEKFAVSFLSENKYDYVIAVDNGGLMYADRLGIVPDLAIGDYDTALDCGGFSKEAVKTIRLVPEKDDTDTEAAINKAVGLGGSIDIICATGGRIDHFLANIHNLKIALDAGIPARIIDEGNVVFLADKSFSMKREDYPGKYISFVPFDGPVKGMKLKGFKYSLDGYTLKPGVSRCISNEFASDTGYVEFESGCLIVINASDVKSE